MQLYLSRNKITGQQIKIKYFDRDYKFVEEINLTFPLISDPDKKLIPLYSGGRIASLFDKQGIVQMIVKGMPTNNDILQKIKQFEK